jgi:uncharacterized membrane protein YeaQ/YmgE (transglycosylase-associated protein family)
LAASTIVTCALPEPRKGYRNDRIATIVLGIVGAVVGGFTGTQLGFGDLSGFDLRSMALAVAGGIAVLFLYGLLRRARA